MKTFLTLAAAVCMMTGCGNANSIQMTEVYQAESFSRIDMDGVGKIVYVQGDEYSVRAEGDSSLISRTTITFNDGCMNISQRGSSSKDEGVTFYISAPALTRVCTSGVGSFEAKEAVCFDNDFTFDMEGVGAVSFSDLTCRNLRFHQEGVGAAEVNVKCNKADYHSEGVGASKLSIEADTLILYNEGVGAVKVKGHVRHYSPQSDGLISKISDKNLKVGE